MSNGARRRPLSAPAPIPLHEPDLSPIEKDAIVRALRWAWGRVCNEWPDIVHTGREEQITERLVYVLNERVPGRGRLAPGLRLFETVVRGAKIRNPNARIEMAPDLAFRPPPGRRTVRILDDWAWFVECKIIDGAGSVQRYCNDGVVRFSDGNYCARMPSGAMLAYVRDRTRPFGTLDASLRFRFQTQAHTARAQLDMSDSLHGRAALPRACTDIALLHLWLDVPSAPNAPAA